MSRHGGKYEDLGEIEHLQNKVPILGSGFGFQRRCSKCRRGRSIRGGHNEKGRFVCAECRA